jgi:tetratricopeptide (TPR) repeat protein
VTGVQTCALPIYALWGLNAPGFHLINIALHALNGILIYLMFIRRHQDRLFALVAASLFLVHPVQVEVVARVSQLRTLLAILFILHYWEGYCRYQDSPPGRKWLPYAFSVAAFALAILTKSVVVIFPVILVLYDLCFSGNGSRLRLMDKVPFVIGAVATAAVNMYFQQEELGGSRVGFHGGGPLATFFTMLPVFTRYLGMLVWPSGLSAAYGPAIHTTFDAAVAGSALLLGIAALAGVWLFRADRRLGFWFLFFWIGLLPVSQVVPMNTIMNDRYLYVPLMGAVALAGAGAAALRERLGQQRRILLYGLLALPVLALSFTSFQRAAVWQDSLTLWQDAAAKEPTSDRAWELLGEASMAARDRDAARRAYERGYALNPLNTEILWGLGNLSIEAGELDKGYPLLKKLLELKPEYVIGWTSLGNYYLKRVNYVQAEKMFLKAQALQPDAVQVVVMLGDLAFLRNRTAEARSYYGQVEAKGWNNPYIAFQLACVESRMGRTNMAMEWAEKALQRGFWDRQKWYFSPDLARLRREQRFHALLQKYIPVEGPGK